MSRYRQETRRYLFHSTGSEWVITLHWDSNNQIRKVHFKDDPSILPGEMEELEQYATELWEEVLAKQPKGTDMCVFDYGQYIDVEFLRRS